MFKKKQSYKNNSAPFNYFFLILSDKNESDTLLLWSLDKNCFPFVWEAVPDLKFCSKL